MEMGDLTVVLLFVKWRKKNIFFYLTQNKNNNDRWMGEYNYKKKTGKEKKKRKKGDVLKKNKSVSNIITIINRSGRIKKELH